MVDSKVLPPAIMFDGATLRFARRTPDGIQLVLWTLQDRRWQRWASALVHAHVRAARTPGCARQQWDAISGNAVTVLENVDTFQVYLCNPDDLPATAAAGTTCSRRRATHAAQAAPPARRGRRARPSQPNGIRITLKVADGELTRERELPRW